MLLCLCIPKGSKAGGLHVHTTVSSVSDVAVHSKLCCCVCVCPGALREEAFTRILSAYHSISTSVTPPSHLLVPLLCIQSCAALFVFPGPLREDTFTRILLAHPFEHQLHNHLIFYNAAVHSELCCCVCVFPGALREAACMRILLAYHSTSTSVTPPSPTT